MLIKELRGVLMHLGRLIVNVGCMFMRSDMPTLMLLVLVFGHDLRLSYDAAERPWHARRRCADASTGYMRDDLAR